MSALSVVIRNASNEDGLRTPSAMHHVAAVRGSGRRRRHLATSCRSVYAAHNHELRSGKDAADEPRPGFSGEAGHQCAR